MAPECHLWLLKVSSAHSTLVQQHFSSDTNKPAVNNTTMQSTAHLQQLRQQLGLAQASRGLQDSFKDPKLHSGLSSSHVCAQRAQRLRGRLVQVAVRMAV